jgi:hypothetical protein
MRRLLVVVMVAGVLPLFVAATADACHCRAARRCCCQPACCAPAPACQEYEEKQITQYKTVFEEVPETVTVNAVKYVPETEYREVVCTVMQPRQTKPCEPAAGCCAPTTCTEMVPVQCVRKVAVTVLRPVAYQTTVERPRVVAKQIPYTVTCRVPKEAPPAPCAPCR